MGTRSFPGVKRPGRGVVHPPHLAPRLKKEYSYTSTPPLGLRGFSRVNFTFANSRGNMIFINGYLRPSFFWDVKPCHWVNGDRRFDGD